MKQEPAPHRITLAPPGPDPGTQALAACTLVLAHYGLADASRIWAVRQAITACTHTEELLRVIKNIRERSKREGVPLYRCQGCSSPVLLEVNAKCHQCGALRLVLRGSIPAGYRPAPREDQRP